MWIADNWKDYELIDASNGERLERWGQHILVRPDPQVIWKTPRTSPVWKRPEGRYSRSHTGGGSWDKGGLPASWDIRYGSLTFHVKPMNFKHTGLFPEQAANWDWMQKKIREADRPISVLNLFLPTPAGRASPVSPRARASATWTPRRAWSPGRRTMPRRPALRTRTSAGSWTTAPNSSSGRSAAGTSMTPSSWIRRPMAADRAARYGSSRTISGTLFRSAPASSRTTRFSCSSIPTRRALPLGALVYHRQHLYRPARRFLARGGAGASRHAERTRAPLRASCRWGGLNGKFRHHSR